MTRPIPLLLVQGPDVPDAAVAALRDSAGVHLVHRDEREGSAPAYTARAARATIVATMRHPIEELVWVRTSGFAGPLVLAFDPRHEVTREALIDAGVADCLSLPIVDGELERVLDVIETLPLPPVSHPPLGLLLDWVNHSARRGDAVVSLTQRQFALLHCLVQNGSRAVPIKEILEHVWGTQQPGAGTRQIVDVNVSQLRKRLDRIGLGDAIRTYRGFGYGLRDDVSDE
jgi:DNA-binding response OmpR family regulator